jgi:hypothetical protein
VNRWDYLGLFLIPTLFESLVCNEEQSVEKKFRAQVPGFLRQILRPLFSRIELDCTLKGKLSWTEIDKSNCKNDFGDDIEVTYDTQTLLGPTPFATIFARASDKQGSVRFSFGLFTSREGLFDVRAEVDASIRGNMHLFRWVPGVYPDFCKCARADIDLDCSFDVEGSIVGLALATVAVVAISAAVKTGGAVAAPTVIVLRNLRHAF